MLTMLLSIGSCHATINNLRRAFTSNHPDYDDQFAIFTKVFQLFLHITCVPQDEPLLFAQCSLYEITGTRLQSHCKPCGYSLRRIGFYASRVLI